LWFMLPPFLSVLIGTIMPQAKRFSTTKLSRRLQWGSLELVILGVLTLIFVGFPVQRGLVQRQNFEHDSINWVTSELEASNAQINDLNMQIADVKKSLASKIGIGVTQPRTLTRNKSPLETKLADLEVKRDGANELFAQYSQYLDNIENKNGEYRVLENNAVTSWKESTPFWTRVKQTVAQNHYLIDLIVVAWLVLYFSRPALARRYAKFARFLEQGQFGQGGSARFAGLIEEWDVNYSRKKNALFMGRSLYSPFLDIGLEDPRHMLTVAGSRAGKGATSIIPNLLLWRGSTLVIDPKGTNAAVTLRARQEMGQSCHVVDPFNVLEKGTCASFNPLSALDVDAPTIREDINIIADALVVPDSHAKDQHWDDGARLIIAGLIAHLVSSGQYTSPTLPMLRDLLTQMPEEQAELWADMSLNERAGGMAKDAATRVIRGIGTNEILGILSNADKHTEWLASPAIQRGLGESTFSFSDLKSEPTTIYLILPPDLLRTHNRFLRLFVNLAINQMARGGRSTIPVLMMLDEFLALGRMEEVHKAFGLMAGYNLTLWPFVQDLGTLKELYGGNINPFITNSRAVQVFGVSDPETTKFVSEWLGTNTSTSSLMNNQQSRVVPIRTPDEVAREINREDGWQYILQNGRSAFVLEKVAYYQRSLREKQSNLLLKWIFSPRFAGKFDKDPDYAKT
ncbi:MAG: type IV secretory system conjugative DNA transfer family protein, partial [Candidatus Hydrogenedentes bacterium]|nr:type IV secretory system conjugative DNA transfer family protein [Candidatus Hydrogenedentota bacterium]